MSDRDEARRLLERENEEREREKKRRLQDTEKLDGFERDFPILLEELRRKTVELEILKTYPDKIASIKASLEESKTYIQEFVGNATLHVDNLKLLSEDFARAKANIDSLAGEVQKGNESSGKLHEKLDRHDRKNADEDATFKEELGAVKLWADTNSDKLDDVLKLIKKLAEDLEKYAKQRILGVSTISRAEMQLILANQAPVDADAVWDELIAGHAIAGSVAAALSSALADTNELQTDWVNGGRLDLLIDSILADTNELQTDWVNGGRLDLIVDAILADTNELQTDWVNGGRLDLLIDSIISKVDAVDDYVDTEVTAIKTETDQLPNWRFSESYSFDAVVEQKANLAEQTLTALSKTITYPTGATKQSAELECYLTAAAQAAGGHKIGVTIQYQKAGGGYADIKDYTAVPPLTIPDADETMGYFAVTLDVSALIDTSGVQYDFLFQVDSDNAGAVNYMSNFRLIMRYSM